MTNDGTRLKKITLNEKHRPDVNVGDWVQIIEDIGLSGTNVGDRFQVTSISGNYIRILGRESGYRFDTFALVIQQDPWRFP